MLRVNLHNIKLLNDNEQKIILRDIKFSCNPNTVNIILGKNGTGKSTLIKSLTRLENTNKFSIIGNVQFNNVDLLSLEEDKLNDIRKKNIRYVFQDAINLFDPLKKLKYYFDLLSANENSIDRMLKEFFLPGYEELKNLYVQELSGGMAQRLSIVMQLYSDPDLLILDEPTSALDQPLANLIMIKLRQFADKDNNAVLLISQDLQSTKKFADNIFVIFNNTLINAQSIKEAAEMLQQSYSIK